MYVHYCQFGTIWNINTFLYFYFLVTAFVVCIGAFEISCAQSCKLSALKIHFTSLLAVDRVNVLS